MTFRAVVLIFLVGMTSVAFAAPSVDDVYAAARAGRLGEADAMIREVLKEKPDSAKAHYVHAQILAAMRDNGGARTELAQAERLAPGLPFARSAAVAELQAKIGSKSAPAAASGQFSWAPIVLIGIVVLAVFFIIRRLMAARSTALAPVSPYSQGNAYPTGPGAAPAPGMGSSIASGLATGLGVGAGIVAGEALAHSLFDREGNQVPPQTPGTDFGGNDFGLNDTSWDSGGDVGGDVGGDW
jgi:hypothetical protein